MRHYIEITDGKVERSTMSDHLYNGREEQFEGLDGLYRAKVWSSRWGRASFKVGGRCKSAEAEAVRLEKLDEKRQNVARTRSPGIGNCGGNGGHGYQHMEDMPTARLQSLQTESRRLIGGRRETA